MDKSATNPICILKVNIKPCHACHNLLKKSLLEIQGVQVVDIDPEKKLVYVTGKVDPQPLIMMIAKLGKKAELISYVKEPEKDDDKQKIVKETDEVMKDKGKGKGKEKKT